MATNDDELKFVTANHEEGVNFKSQTCNSLL